MMKTKPYKLVVPPINFPANGSPVTTVSIPIPGGPLDTCLDITITGAPTLTSGNNVAANWLRGDECALLADMRLKDANGQLLCRSNGHKLRLESFFRNKRFPEVTAVIGDGVTANPPFNTTLRFNLSAIDLNNNMDIALFTRMTGGCTLELDIAPPNYLNSAATGWTTIPVVEVTRYPSTGPHVPLFMPLKRLITGGFSASQTGEQKIPISAGSNPIHGFIITLLAGDTNGATWTTGSEQPSLSKTIAVGNGQTSLINKRTWAQTWQSNALRRGLPQLFNRALGAADADDVTGAASGFQQRFSQNKLENVYASLFVEFPIDGNISGMLSGSTNMNDLHIDLDLTATTNWEVLVIEAFPLTDAVLASAPGGGIARPPRRDRIVEQALLNAGLFNPAQMAALGYAR
ncbi:MAG TPA: hypothetical protein VFE58_09010 [Tepidisphaeraceae bacterium]|jgi:hypothetical protein|nr:hypothetical protein [Tepidisphaeraceae bacterium]